MIRAPSLAPLGAVRHAFFTREGGVSEGPYASLNCGLGSGDEAASVAENRARAMAALGLEAGALCTAYQVHGTTATVAESPWAPERRPRADVLVTTVPGLAIGVLTADCAPILLADPDAGVIGAAHAGWRGALAGVVEAAVAAMDERGAERGRIRAAIGPCIAQDAYEVGPEFPGPFLAEDPENARFFAPARRQGHFHFDLAGYVGERLEAQGVAAVDRLDHDTVGTHELFFSYRRARLAGEQDYGRALSAIALEP